jgi:RNA 3'-terminal phosphate cyclase (ATP)
MIEIDGSHGEGGGQILRTALSLSCLLQKPFRIFNIRKSRRKPGLMPQHVTGVAAAQLISDADVRGNNPGSTELVFSPGKVKAGDFVFDIGTAGSTMLVLQTLAPPLMFTNRRSSITLKGGTHVPLSPSYHYVAEVFAPFLRKIGLEITLSIESYGFYPKGGGKIIAELMPVTRLSPLRFLKRGKVLGLKGFSGVGNLPLSIAERQWNALVETFRSRDFKPGCRTDVEIMDVASRGQGTFLFLRVEAENSLAGFAALGERGRRAELVGAEAAKEFLQYYDADVALDPYLADQIALYLSLCNEQSVLTISRVTEHLRTNLWVIGLFHRFRHSLEGETGKPGKILIGK